MKGPFGSEYIPAHRPEGSTPQYGSGSLAPFQGKTVLIDNYDSFTYNIVEVRIAPLLAAVMWR